MNNSSFCRTQQAPNDKKIGIVFVIDFLATRDGITGGTERQLIEIINHLDQTKFRPILFCLQEFVTSPYWEQIKCEKYLLHVYSLTSYQGLQALYKFSKFLRKNSIQIVQTFFFDSMLFGVAGARLAGVKHVITSRRDLGFWQSRKLLWLTKMANFFTQRIIANSHAVKKMVNEIEGFPLTQIDVIYNGIDQKKIESVGKASLQNEFQSIGNDDVIVGIVANLNRQVKRVDLFIQAASLVVEKIPKVKFLIIGDGKLRSALTKLSQQLGIAEQCIFCGAKENAIPYIKNFSIGILTSDSEGFPNAILEYMALGIPVVATDSGGTQELVQNGKTGFLVPKGDHKQLAEKITALLSQPYLMENIGKAGKTTIRESYRWDKKIQEMENYFFNLVPLT